MLNLAADKVAVFLQFLLALQFVRRRRLTWHFCAFELQLFSQPIGGSREEDILVVLQAIDEPTEDLPSSRGPPP